MEEIEANNIKIYALPDCDPDEDEFYKEKVSFSVLLVFSVFISVCNEMLTHNMIPSKRL